MKIEKHQEIINEVLEEINSALNDKRGLLSHQRRLAFSLSLGAVNILEQHFHILNIIKEGSKINHRLFKKKENRLKDYLQRQIVSQIDSIENINEIIKLVKEIENKRDDIAYGPPVKEEILQEKINLFLKLKKVVKC